MKNTISSFKNYIKYMYILHHILQECKKKITNLQEISFVFHDILKTKA